MVVTIKKSDFDNITAYAKQSLPHEVCGLVAGRKEKENIIIEKVYYLTNTDHSREHFSMDPKEQLQAVKDMRANGMSFLGNWHSHPETPSRPSKEDIRLAYDEKAVYLILSLEDPFQPVLNAFHIIRGEAQKDELYIIP